MVFSNEVKKSGGLWSFHWLDCFFVRDRFVSHIGLLQNSIYNLLFQYNRRGQPYSGTVSLSVPSQLGSALRIWSILAGPMP